MDFKRLPDETEEAFVFRVCSHKAEIGNWGDVASVLNTELNQNKCDDAYRKQYRKMTSVPIKIDPIEYTTFGAAECEEQISLPECVNKDEMERQKRMADKLEVNRFIRQQSRFELFYDRIRDVVKPLEPPAIKPWTSEYANALDVDYVLTIGDIHLGSFFESENNSYDIDTAEGRMEHLLGDVIDFVQKNDVNHLSVVNLGDDIHGLLRLSDLQLNEWPVVECVVKVARVWAAFLNQLSGYVDIDYYAVSSSNHSQTRPLGSKASELAGEDVEKIINAYIDDMLANNHRVNVNYDMEKDYIWFNVLNFDVIAMHGHQIKNVDTAIKDISALHQRFYDYMLLGHVHHAEEITVGERDGHNVEVLISPSIIGSCPYADKIMRGSKASAKLYKFHEAFGHVASWNFILN